MAETVTFSVSQTKGLHGVLQKDPNTSRYSSPGDEQQGLLPSGAVRIPDEHPYLGEVDGRSGQHVIFDGPGANARLIYMETAQGERLPTTGRDSMTRAQWEQSVRVRTLAAIESALGRLMLDQNRRDELQQRKRTLQGASGLGGAKGLGSTRPTRGGGGAGRSRLSSFFGGGAGTRVGDIGAILADPSLRGDFLDPGGTLSFDAQAALVEGLDLEDMSPELLELLDSSAYIEFLVWDDGSGTIQYIDARLLSLSQLNENAKTAKASMNFPSAYSYLESGYSIARKGWDNEGGSPAKVLRHVDGVVYIGIEGAWEVVTSRKNGEGGDPNLAAADLAAADWYVVGAVSSLLLPRPDLEVKF